MISKPVLTYTGTSGRLGRLLGMTIAVPGLSVPPG